MLIDVLLFGPLASRVGQGSVRIELSEKAATIAVVREHLGRTAPIIAEALPACRFAVNHAFVEDSCVVSDTDEIAVVGFVSGG